MRQLVAMLSVAVLIGCSDNSTNPMTDTISGVYRLVTVNDAALPATVPFLNSHIGLIDDQLVLSANSTFLSLGNAQFTHLDGSTTIEPIRNGGSYVLNGSTLALTFNSPDATGKGVISGNVLLITVAGDRYLYAK